MKKTETSAKTNAIIEATNTSQVSISEKLFFTYTDELVKAKLDLVGKTGQMLAAIKGYIPLNIIDVQRVEYIIIIQTMLLPRLSRQSVSISLMRKNGSSNSSRS